MGYPLIALAGIAFAISCGSDPSAAKVSPTVIPVTDPLPEGNDIPFDLINKFAVEMSVWHFDSTDDVEGILADAHRLGITFSEEELNNSLDEDERKRLWRVGAAEYHLGRLYGEEAQAVFKVRHYVSLAGLWVEKVGVAGTPAERKGYIMIAGGNIGIAARVLREMPANRDCWDVNGCEPRPPMRPVTFTLDPRLASEGTEISDRLLSLSRIAEPEVDSFIWLMEQAGEWDERVCDALARGD
ncbi:MAG: hypothetical protein WBM17_06430 [Anaerolineales bacterium]